MPSAILILAAGASSRWGRPKALLPWGDDCLVNHLASVALDSGAAAVVRVLGAHAQAITAHPAPVGVGDVINPHWVKGMGASIAAGLREALSQNPALTAVAVLPCDLPLVTAAHLRACLNLVDTNPACIVRSDYGNGSFGPPSAFGQNYFVELLELDGDEGARCVMQRHPEQIVTLNFPDGRWDLDTYADLQRLQQFLTEKPTS